MMVSEDRGQKIVGAIHESPLRGTAAPLFKDCRTAATKPLSPVVCPLSSELRGTLRQPVDMRKHTSWRAGGVAEHMYQPADLDDLLVFLRSMPADEPLYAVGLGSNLLVRDGGLRGMVLLLHSALSELRLETGRSVDGEAGGPGAKLARFAARHELSGAEFFAGIPGTLGGMLAMNAGCYGSETWEKVLRVQTVNRRGGVHVRMKEDYEIGY